MIVEHANRNSPYRPLAYNREIDSATLRSLCFTSKLFNSIATPFLYSSIAPRTNRHIQSLARTAKEQPHLLKGCHSLLLPKAALKLMDDLRVVTSSTPALRRCLFVGSNSPEPILPLLPASSISDICFPERTAAVILKLQGFENLQRLTLAHIPFMNRTVVDTLLSLQRLSHVTFVHFSPEQYCPIPGFKDGVIKVLKHRALRRIVFAWEPWAHNYSLPRERDLCEEFHQQLEESLPTYNQPTIVFVMYGMQNRKRKKWIRDRILDGTIWELES
jgi:hypothetical protein